MREFHRVVPTAPTSVTARSSPLGVVVEWTGTLPPRPSPSPTPSPTASPGATGTRPAGAPEPPTPLTRQPSPPEDVAAAAEGSKEQPSAAPSTTPDVTPNVPQVPASPSPAPKTPAAKPTPKPAPTSGFWVYRRTANGAFSLPLSANPVDTQAFEDTTAKAGEKVCYVVRTVLSTDPRVESGDSDEACLEVKDLSVPAAPTGLTAIVRGSAVELSWSPSSEPDVVAYRIYRAPSGSPLRCLANDRLADVPVNQTSYQDTVLLPGIAYLYGVAARDKSGNESECSAMAEGGIQ